MALTAADSPGFQPGTIVSGNATLASLQGQAMAQGGGAATPPPGQAAVSPLIQKWQTYFDRPAIPQLQGPGIFGEGFYDPRRAISNQQGPGMFGNGFWDPNKAAATASRISEQEQKDADRARLQDFANRLTGGDATPQEVAELWAWALEQMSAAEALGDDPKDPWYWLEKNTTETEAKRAEEEEKAGPRTVTRVQRTYDITTPEDAEALIRNAAQDYLGKRMSDEDMAKFVATLNAKEKANPTVDTVVDKYDGVEGEPIDSTVTTTGGAPEPGAVADNFLDENFNADADIYRAGTKYADVLAQFVGGFGI